MKWKNLLPEEQRGILARKSRDTETKRRLVEVPKLLQYHFPWRMPQDTSRPGAFQKLYTWVEICAAWETLNQLQYNDLRSVRYKM